MLSGALTPRTTFPSNPFAAPAAAGARRVRRVRPALSRSRSCGPVSPRRAGRSRRCSCGARLAASRGSQRAQVCLRSGQCHDPPGALHILPRGTRQGRGRKQIFLRQSGSRGSGRLGCGGRPGGQSPPPSSGECFGGGVPAC